MRRFLLLLLILIAGCKPFIEVPAVNTTEDVCPTCDYTCPECATCEVCSEPIVCPEPIICPECKQESNNNTAYMLSLIRQIKHCEARETYYINITDCEEEIDDLEDDLKDCEDDFDDCDSDYDGCRDDLETCRDDLNNCE